MFKQTLGKNYKDRESVSHFLLMLEVTTAMAIHLLIGMFKQHMVRQHGLHSPRNQGDLCGLKQTIHAVFPPTLSPHLKSCRLTSICMKLVAWFMLYLGLVDTTVTRLTATVLSYAGEVSSSS